jgi:hypothetical protein
VAADERIKADKDRICLKYGPLVYNVEAMDNKNIDQKLGKAPLQTEWQPDLLGGVMVIKGSWEDGTPMLAIPNYARMNRVGPPHAYPGEAEADDTPATTAAGVSDLRKRRVESKVWI